MSNRAQFDNHSDGLPSTGFLRLKQILGDPGNPNATPPIIPISPASWWAGIARGMYPKPFKLSANTTVWDVASIRALIEQIKSQQCSTADSSTTS